MMFNVKKQIVYNAYVVMKFLVRLDLNGVVKDWRKGRFVVISGLILKASKV